MTDDAQSLAEQCGTSVHATEALLCNLQEQKIKHYGPYRTAQPDALRHRQLRMTGTEPHTPRGNAGRGPNWDRGPRADHAGAARRCTKRQRRLWAQPGPWAVHGPRELRVDACTPRHRRPRDPFGIAGRKRAGGAARLGAGATRRHIHISAPPAARPFWYRGLRAGRRSCATRSGSTRLRMPISAPPAA
jgi:hypothetical protein